ncbi:type III ribulose-bisphosphate carboxylase [Candidatus Micrarchaeota archaeon]|nr:type III ribulose-bisphosphate carboxylase [Candidatus Micrarchaeota archaeon]
MGFTNLKYKPKENDLICKFYVEPGKLKKQLTLKEAAEHITAESSIGTWTDVGGISPALRKKITPHIFYINTKDKTIKIAYPSGLFETGNMSQIMSAIAGNIFGMKELKNLRLLDISFPKDIIKSFKGPEHGIEGIRKIAKIKKRPFCGTIVKPKVGRTAKGHAQYAYEAWSGGLDLVKDDENLTDMKFNKFEERVIRTLEMRDKVESETGEKKLYVCNVSAESNEMLRRAQFINDHGGRITMIDILTCGWAGFETLRNHHPNLIVHAHRAGHGMFTHNPRNGMTMLAVAKIARLIGSDSLHIGTFGMGKMRSEYKEELNIRDALVKKRIDENDKEHVLEQNWHNIKYVMPVSSGGLYPGVIPETINRGGTDLFLQAGGGVAGHPNGVRSGAKAMRQAIDSFMKKQDILEYAKEHKELGAAIKKWGIGKRIVYYE